MSNTVLQNIHDDKKGERPRISLIHTPLTTPQKLCECDLSKTMLQGRALLRIFRPQNGPLFRQMPFNATARLMCAFSGTLYCYTPPPFFQLNERQSEIRINATGMHTDASVSQE